MKKLFIILLPVCFTANSIFAQISIAPEFGLNLANLAIVSSGERISTTYSFKFHSQKEGISLGGIVNYSLSRHIYLEPGLFYEMTGAQIAQNNVKETYSINTIEIPVNINYKFAMKKDTDYYFFGIGGYAADNISGRLKDKQSRSLNIGSTDGTDDIKAIDCGIGLNIGRVVAYRYLVRMHYQLGLSNLYPGGEPGNSIKASSFGITIGYFIIGKSHKKTA